MSNTPADKRRARPLSPHLSIYKPQITSMMSISNRAAGGFTLIGIYVFALWLASPLFGADYYNTVTDVLSSQFGMIALFAWSVTATYYFFHGLRHLAWDMGYGFEMKTLRITGALALIGTAVTVYFLWGYFYGCGCMSGLFNAITGQ